MTTLAPAESFRLMEQRLATGKTRLTLTEAAALTGLSLDAAESALRDLLIRYDCHLQVTENGDIIYDFGPRLRRRDEKSWREYRDDALRLLWKAFVLFFKAWIAVTLVVYFLVFLAILVIGIFSALSAGKSQGRSKSQRSGGGKVISGLLRLFAAIFEWNTATPKKRHRTDQKGYAYTDYQPRPALLREQQADSKNFIASVYDFVFGPPRVARDPLESQKEIAAYLRRNKGILMLTEVKALTGLASDPAALLFSDCIGRFQGDIRISGHKLMYGQFDRLLRATSDQDDAKIVYYWDEYEPPHLLTGNTPNMNALIIFLNGFNLFFSLLGLAGVFGEGAAQLWLGLIPCLFSTIFFAVPLLRLPGVLSREARRGAENRRKRVMRAIFAARGGPQTAERIVQAVNAPGSPEPLSQKAVEDILARLVRDLPGEIRVDARGQAFYEFPIIAMELEEAERLRRQRTVERDLGKVVFDTRQ
ncbi:MAG: hypothetical protein CFK52_06260 [Chloracidobacterium sp. CP2_5A]|nr:MAG: hypothetical protein CFK52_06260 [Chloracidobacterium sp. CP2_5A]